MFDCEYPPPPPTFPLRGKVGAHPRSLAAGNYKLKIKQLIVALSITLLCACGNIRLPGSKFFDTSVYNKWVGHNIDELIIANGEPEDIRTIPGGGRAFEYLNLKETISTQTSTPQENKQRARSYTWVTPQEEKQLPGYQKTLDAENVQPPQVISTPGLPGFFRKRPPKKGQTLAEERAKECKILFNVSATDIIESWSIEGENCN